jgi:hypothetical protein
LELKAGNLTYISVTLWSRVCVLTPVNNKGPPIM